MPHVTAVTAVREWLNGRADLVGTGNPIQLGAHRHRIRSPGQGVWVVLSRVGGSGDLLAEESVDRARIGAVVYAGTDEAAEAAAVAYANAIEALSGGPVSMGGQSCLVADNITGPQLIDQHADDGEQYAYQVDADFYLI